MLDVYRGLFSALADAPVPYAVFKGFAHLAEDLRGERGDVDVWVEPAQIDRMVAIAREHGFFEVRWESRRRAAFSMVGWDLATGRRASLHVHRVPYARRRRTLVPLMFLYEREVELGGVDKSTGARFSTREWTDRFVAQKEALLAGPEWRLFARTVFRPRTIRRLGFRFSAIETARTYRALLSSLVRFRGRSPVSRRGLLVAISGVDGSGKSTLIDTLHASRFLASTQGVVRRYFGNRDFWIPGLARAVKRRPRSRLVKLVVLTLSIVDRKMRILSALAARRRGRIVVCDRYYFDHRVGDPTAKYLPEGRLKRVVDRIVRWVPARPDLALYLRVSAQTARARKPEKSLDEFDKAIAGYDGVFAEWEGTVVVDAEQEAAAVAEFVRAAIAAQLRAEGGTP